MIDLQLLTLEQFIGEGLIPPRAHKFRVKDSEEAEPLTERGVGTTALALWWAGPGRWRCSAGPC